MKAPCETIVWYLLPTMRAEIAKSLLSENLSQSDVAGKLGLTRAAICQYTKKKRGEKTTLDEESKKEMEIFAKRIAKEDLSQEDIMQGICGLCNKLRTSLMDDIECPSNQK